MADGDVDFVRVPITLDVDGSADSAVVNAAAALFPVATYADVTITIIPPTGTKTKGLLVIAGKAIA